MSENPQTYSERRRLIEGILDPLFGVSSMVPTNTDSVFEPGLSKNSLMCSWADPETLTGRTLSVHIEAVPDGNLKAADLREMIEDEAVVASDQQPPEAEAYEISGLGRGEYIFVLNYLGRLTAIADNCVVDLMPYPVNAPLERAAEAALAIARSIGCSPYINDFQPPVLDTSKVTGAWGTAEGWVYDPRTPPGP